MLATIKICEQGAIIGQVLQIGVAEGSGVIGILHDENNDAVKLLST